MDISLFLILSISSWDEITIHEKVKHHITNRKFLPKNYCFPSFFKGGLIFAYTYIIDSESRCLIIIWFFNWSFTAFYSYIYPRTAKIFLNLCINIVFNPRKCSMNIKLIAFLYNTSLLRFYSLWESLTLIIVFYQHLIFYKELKLKEVEKFIEKPIL